MKENNTKRILARRVAHEHVAEVSTKDLNSVVGGGGGTYCSCRPPSGGPAFLDQCDVSSVSDRL